MATKKRGLGRGLNALLAGSKPAAMGSDAADEKEVLKHLPVDLMQRGQYQPRVDMHPETLQELADSIKAQGVVQPIIVRSIGNDRYEIIAGERRWRASQMAGLQDVPCVVRDVSDQAAMAMALIENIQREDLNPMEEARALQRLIKEFELTHQQVAEAVGRSRAAVSNLLRLLDLEDDVRILVEHGDLDMGHARALLALESKEQLEAARTVAADNLSVREAERLVKRLLALSKKGGEAVKVVDPNVRRLEERLSETLAAKVNIKHGAKDRGTIVIHYNSLDELDGILVHMNGKDI